MPKTIYNKKNKNGKEYYFYRLRHPNLKSPRDIYAINIRELEKKIKTLNYELDNGILSTKISFEGFFCNWLFDVHLINKKPSTCEKYEGLYRNYVKNSCVSNVNIKDISLKDIQNYYNNLYKKGITVSTIKNLNKLVAPCIRYAYDNNLILKDFSKAIIVPKENEDEKLIKKDTVNPFTLNEQLKFMELIVD